MVQTSLCCMDYNRNLDVLGSPVPSLPQRGSMSHQTAQEKQWPSCRCFEDNLDVHHSERERPQDHRTRREDYRGGLKRVQMQGPSMCRCSHWMVMRTPDNDRLSWCCLSRACPALTYQSALFGDLFSWARRGMCTRRKTSSNGYMAGSRRSGPFVLGSNRKHGAPFHRSKSRP